MDLKVWITYFLATVILSVTPGPGVFSSISSGLHHGFRLGLWNGIGMQLSSVIWVCVVALGVGAILIFSAPILPQFIDVARPQLQQYAILAATTFVVDVAIMMAYTALAAKVLGVMRNEQHLRWVNRTLGGTFVAAGVALASFRR